MKKNNLLKIRKSHIVKRIAKKLGIKCINIKLSKIDLKDIVGIPNQK